MSDDGYVTITGRIKDLIIRGGENIHPLEIENCLFAHPGVLNVTVVGVPDERYGETVAAYVVPREEGDRMITVQEIKDWVRERLSRHLGKVPSILVSIVSSLKPLAHSVISHFPDNILSFSGHGNMWNIICLPNHIFKEQITSAISSWLVLRDLLVMFGDIA